MSDLRVTVEGTVDLAEWLHVEAGLDARNDLEYLLGLIGDALRDEEFGDDDGERARWVVDQWCQEVGYTPDLSGFETGECVPMPGDREAGDE